MLSLSHHAVDASTQHIAEEAQAICQGSAQLVSGLLVLVLHSCTFELQRKLQPGLQRAIAVAVCRPWPRLGWITAIASIRAAKK